MGQIAGHIQQISAKTQEIESIVGSMEEGLVMLDAHLNILLINRQACKFLEIPRESWQKKITYLYRDKAFAQVLEKTRAQGVRQIEDIPYGEKSYRFYVNPVPEGGFVLLISDVTELTHLENIRSEFVANVSHELKTPLTSISGFAELLGTGMAPEPEKVTRYAGKILTESKRLMVLIDDLLVLSSIENSPQEDREPEDLRGVMKYVLEMLAARLEEKQVTARIEGGLWIRTSYAQMVELGFNLCENGVKYNCQGGELTIRFLPDGFSVADTGIGIAPEHRERIFERFYRVDKARSRKTGGTGLGLSIAKHIMVLYGGTISVQSEEKSGSIFTARFPANLIHHPQQGGEQDEAEI